MAEHSEAGGDRVPADLSATCVVMHSALTSVGSVLTYLYHPEHDDRTHTVRCEVEVTEMIICAKMNGDHSTHDGTET